MNVQKSAIEKSVETLIHTKKVYNAPRLTAYGTIQQLTHGKNAGSTEGSGKSNNPSDRNVKENFAMVDTREVLARVISLPVETWNYKSDAPAVRHMGPMAQDFAAAFGLGDDDRHIHNVDANGVALAAIQALYQIVQRQQEQIDALQAELRNLLEPAEAI